MANNPYEEAYLGDGGASYMPSWLEVPQQVAQGNPYADQMADKLGTIIQAVPNLVLDPKSQGYPDTLAFLSKVAPDVAKWLTYNATPPGMVWQSSKNIAETVQDPNMPLGEKIPAVLTDAAMAAMAMAPVQLGKAGAKGLDKLGGYAEDLVSGGLNPEATKRVMAALESGNSPLTNELGVLAGKNEKPTGLKPKAVGATESPVFYRGTVPGETRRIPELFPSAKGLTFVARTEKAAKNYGDNIEQFVANHDAKILREEDSAFWKLVGRKKPPNGYIGSSLRKGETPVEAIDDAIKKAKEAGYDAISFQSDDGIGTVLLNEKSFRRE